MSTVSEPQSKQCNRCGETIIWNTSARFYESLAFPKYQHCCKLPCNKQGCGGSIYFSKLCPPNPETGRPRPLDFPVPQIDPNNKAQMIWVVHVHKNNVAADVPTEPQQAPPAPVTTAVSPAIAQGQESLVAHIPVQGENVFAEAQKVQNPVAQTANRDVEGTLIQGLNEIRDRLDQITSTLEAVVPKLNVIAGKIADGSIKTASDLVAHHLEQ